MDSTGIDGNEPSVDEGAFWHTNMDLYYGYLPGEVVEVEHEQGKYWLARIQYCYKHLLLLKWVGDYGEFWMDTSQTSGPNTSIRAESGAPKRVFPLGYHFQSQAKSQFSLEKPTKVLVAPSLYNPACDPYANIKTVDDLLAHEADEEHSNKDAPFVDNPSNENLELALACKKKIEYKQEDVDELEAALQNLNYAEDEESACRAESPVYKGNNVEESGDSLNAMKDKDGDNNGQVLTTKDSGIDSEPSSERPSTSPDRKVAETADGEKCADSSSLKEDADGSVNAALSEDQNDQIERDIMARELCAQLLGSALDSGFHYGLNWNCTEPTDEVFHLKPKQFYDMGGANHERLLVPGTLVEVCHTSENAAGNLDIFFWFAYVIKNTGGRLLLRWFLCDEPKFRQGRLEIKSSRSYLVAEESEQARGAGGEQAGDNEKNGEESGTEASGSKLESISAQSITFSLHFCHPKIHTLQHAEKNQKQYQLPKSILNYITKGSDDDTVANKITKEHLDHIFDTRRMNLDKDRPLIDNLLAAVRFRSPSYLDLISPADDTKARREVLISCPKLTKLLKATVVRQLEAGAFEIHSDPIPEDNDVIKFVYPYDSCHAVLPLDWANNNEDCLSVDPSRNPTPDELDKGENKPEGYQCLIPETADSEGRKSASGEGVASEFGEKQSVEAACLNTVCLMNLRKVLPKIGGPFKKVPETIVSAVLGDNEPEFKRYDQAQWSKALGSKEMRATTFHCCIDHSLKEAVESRFKVMDQLEVTHPSSDSTICMGRIRKVVFPLLWVQLSPDCYTLVPYNSTDIYPAKWCVTHCHKVVSLLPPRKRCLESGAQNKSKKRKKIKTTTDDARPRVAAKIGAAGSREQQDDDQLYEKEQFNLGDIYDRQLDFDFILQEKNNYITIYFNHKCFTGPSLSKSKICSLPQYVGPGPMHLVLEEVVTKVISVAYVPPRILNDLCSKSFEELLVERKLTNTKNQTFKAKYQKRVHRERVPVCLSPDDIALYCECICEHIKCCYNLFGPQLYDGDDCPSHCRSLTKSNKFMKRATYYREKARQGDYLASESPSAGPKKSGSTGASNDEAKIPREGQAGRDSSESTNSSILSRSEQVQSRASSASSCDGEGEGDRDGATNDLKESLKAAMEGAEVERGVDKNPSKQQNGISFAAGDQPTTLDLEASAKSAPRTTYISNGYGNTPESDCQNQPEFDILDSNHQKISSPEDWTVEDVVQFLDWCQLSMFKSNIEAEGIDGQALLLLDDDAIRDHFGDEKRADFTSEEVDKLCRFIGLVKTRAEMRV